MPLFSSKNPPRADGSDPPARKAVTAHEPYERSEHVIEAASELGFDIWHVAERRGHFEAREHLAQRTERRVVARRAILATRIRTFRQVQRRTAECSPTLPGQIGIAPLEFSNEWPHRPNEFQQNGIDA